MRAYPSSEGGKGRPSGEVAEWVAGPRERIPSF